MGITCHGQGILICAQEMILRFGEHMLKFKEKWQPSTSSLKRTGIYFANSRILAVVISLSSRYMSIRSTSSAPANQHKSSKYDSK